MRMEDLIAITEMAKLHGITRQTLIYYDEIDLFKPVRVDEKGYRYYSRRQIPFLREICFLKTLGFSLKDIVEHLSERSPQKEMELLTKQKDCIIQQITKLNQLREYLKQRISLYEDALDAEQMHMDAPFIRHLEPRKALFAPYIMPINKGNLHITLMSLWQKIFSKELVPSSGFGSIIKKEAFNKGDFLAGAGSCIFLPLWNKEHTDTVEIPAGEYVCMYKRGMPYNISYLEHLKEFLDSQGYQLAGDIIDVCLLDTTFYQKPTDEDLCMLQAPVVSK